MAIYEYACDDCEETTDIELPMGETVDLVCRCGARMRRVYGSTPHVFKNARGQNVRPPGKEWVGGETFDRRRFMAENPGVIK
jgi:putative FmdB family regulatory protein